MVTVVQYMKGIIGVNIPDDTISVILDNRGILESETISALTVEQKDLLRADIYSYCTTIPSTSGVVDDSDGDWRHREGGIKLSEQDKRRMERIANAIYRKYGETVMASSSIRIVRL